MTRTFKLLPLVAIMSTAWVAQAQQHLYSPDMIRALVPEGQDVNLDFFEQGFDISPGNYRFNVHINGDWLKAATYEIRELDGTLQPVFRVQDVKGWPLKEEVLVRLKDMPDTKEIFPVSSLIEGVRTKVDSADMKIQISIPQIHLADNSGWVDVVDPELWDYGENAAVINYSISGNHSKSRKSDFDTSNMYGNMSARLNIGAWRLYSSGSFNINKTKYEGFTDTDHSWDLWNTYMQRDIPTLKGTLQLGELSTSGEIFDSMPMRGFRISTNEQMLSRRERSYAPIIEGIANSNAQIIIRQNNHVVYTLNVAPGPFKLDNLPNFGDFGDLEVVIREADGTERIMNVPFSSVPNMLREGQYRYDFNVGRYYYKGIGHDVEKPLLFMGTLAYGFPHDITLYGGSILSEQYAAFALGSGLSLGSYGAVAADVIHSRHANDEERGLKAGSGAAWRVRYEKNMLNTGTTVNLANYQYITGNYATLQDIVEYDSVVSNRWWGYGQVRSRWQLSMSQRLGNLGSLSIGADYSKYHGDVADGKSFNINYGTSVKGVGLSLSYARNYIKTNNGYGREWDSNHTVMLNVNVPLSLFFRSNGVSALNSTSVSYQGRMEKSIYGDKSYQQSVVMNGYAPDLSLNWTLAQDLGNNEERSTSLNMSYSGDRFNADWGIDHNKWMNNYQLGINGALVLHKTGATLAANAYDSIAIIEVPQAEGVKIAQNFDTTTDMFGHSIITYLNNYTRNEFAIDPATLPEGSILLDGTNRVVIPTQGSVVRVKYPVRFGKQAVFILNNNEAKPLPFGSKVELLDEDGKVDSTVTGLIGEGGRVYLSGIPKQGTLRVIDGKTHHNFDYEVKEITNPNENEFTPIEVINLMSK